MRSLPIDVMEELFSGSSVEVIGEAVGNADGSQSYNLAHKNIIPYTLRGYVNGVEDTAISLAAGQGPAQYAQIKFDTAPTSGAITATYTYITDDNDYIWPVYLLDIGTGATPLRITNCDIDVYIEDLVDGVPTMRTYLATGMDFGATEFSISPTADKVSCEIDNTDLAMSTLVMANATDIRGQDVLLRLAFLDSNVQVIGTLIMFAGLVDTIRITKVAATFSFYNHLILWKKRVPRRKHTAQCPYTFKDADTCAYGGAQTVCDKSWDQCLSYGNTPNFGGFREVNSLVDKQITWGFQPK